ncbi:malonyl-CoA decarboxylase, mitochondrial [Lingula anatina]|uniref:Malonyl-CoA decarboxylase, mitochondrial n=1 Tax=Lingula anatina TaxID=7574 RepID=A0A1S3JV45_LINAN|nr:malonyl-CoA decarboxylase, mitochondrial [Lingula anatina]|eukprot:XP_013413971.1 malonyl-CoA decarboxylase, mitochondrial [Lingula anatina]
MYSLRESFKGLFRPQAVVSSSSSPTTIMSPSHSMSSLAVRAHEMLDSILGAQETSSTTVADNQARDLCHFYCNLIPEDKAVFLKTLAHDYGVDHNIILQIAQNLSMAQERGEGVLLKTEERLKHALVPKYNLVFTQIGHLNDGVKFLVDMRADILHLLNTTCHSTDQDNPYLKSLINHLRDLIAIWFSVGFMTLERVTWESACDVLQKISEYEAVHPIRNWTDLKRRVGPYRRCYVFTHHSMPREPVVVLHTALTDEISNSIQSIVSHPGLEQESSVNGARKEDPNSVNTAIFYSITSTQKGLQGIELGNYLIKRVVQELQSEFSQIQQFASLSPIPGFREWLLLEMNRYLHAEAAGEYPEQKLFTGRELQEIADNVGDTRDKSTIETIMKLIKTNNWAQSEFLPDLLKEPLMRLCARYLYVEKRRGFAFNPVANFHLRNGAVMWRLNWLADTTTRGLSASCGMMINYCYFLEKTEENSKVYMEKHHIEASPQILELVKANVGIETKSHL